MSVVIMPVDDKETKRFEEYQKAFLCKNWLDFCGSISKIIISSVCLSWLLTSDKLAIDTSIPQFEESKFYYTF